MSQIKNKIYLLICDIDELHSSAPRLCSQTQISTTLRYSFILKRVTLDTVCSFLICSSNMHVFVQVPECQLEELKLSLDSNLMKCSIVICSHMRPLCFYKISRSRSGESDSLLEVPLKEVQDAVVLCVSAIGCPESLALCLMQVFLPHLCLIIEITFILYFSGTFFVGPL